ncbi:MAG: LPS export ABC transporter permease LptG [Gammaproteobacteria bacterium]
MKMLQGYIGRTVLLAIFGVTAALVMLDFVFSLLAEIEDLRGNYQFMQALQFMLLTLPRRLYQMIPTGTLLGCLVALGALANNSELVVMRAAGVSLLQILWAALRPVLLVAVGGLLIGEYLAPYTEQIAQSARAVAMGSGKALHARSGVWHKEGSEYIHVNAVEPGGRLFGVTRLRFDEDGRLQQASQARTAVFQSDHWSMEDVEVTELGQREARISRFDTLAWYTSLDPKLLALLTLDPDDLSITGLWQYANYLGEQGLDAEPYFLAFWTKILQPLMMCAMVFIAISYVFGPLRQVTMGLRVLAGILTGLVLRYFGELAGTMSLVYEFSPLLAATLPLVLGMTIGLWALRRSG